MYTGGCRRPRSGRGASSPLGRGRPGSDRFWAASGGPHMRGVDHGTGPVQLPRRLQLSEEQLVQLLPDPGPVPLLESPPAGHPGPEPELLGRNSHWMPVCSTNRIPHNTCRSGIRLRPGRRGSRGTGQGSNGSIRCHNPSGTIHGGCSPRLTVTHRRSPSTKDGIPSSAFVRNSKAGTSTRRRHTSTRERGLLHVQEPY